MKLRNFIFDAAVSLAATCAVVTPTWATDIKPEPRTIQPEPRTVEPEPRTEVETDDGKTPPDATFSAEGISDESGIFQFGKNLLFAGNNATINQIARGLLFAAGNSLQFNSQSEYAFIAGNVVTFDATTEKDLFIAGNSITINKNAEIGRDVFVGANSLLLEANILGDVSAAAAKVTLRDVIIEGNVNLDAGTISFEGQVEIKGTLVHNNDAEIFGLSNVKYGKLETYIPETHTSTAGEIWISKMMSLAGLFFTMAIIILVFPNVKKNIAHEATAQRFKVDLIYGLIFMIVVPLLSFLFLVSFLAVSTSIFLVVVCCLIFYLAKAFVGTWLGHVIVEKLCHCTLPMLLEALIGILIITCTSLIPGLSLLISVFTFIFGSGLIVACLRPHDKQSSEDKRVYYAAEETTPSQKSVKSPTKTKTSKATSSKTTSSKTSKKSKTKK